MLDISDREVLAALLDAQQVHRSVKLYLQDGSMPLNSTVLGFNYYESSLLLDAISPALSAQQQKSLSQVPVWVQLRHEDRFLNVLCLLEDSQFDLHTLKILQCEFTQNQRWFSRVHFDPRKGPKLRMDLPHALPLYGYLRNLSVHGAMVEFYGEDIREQLRGLKQCHCLVRFNELFQLQLNCDIKHLSFERRPSCHSQLRLMFAVHTEVSYSQIENFIDALKVEDTPLPALKKLEFSKAMFA